MLSLSTYLERGRAGSICPTQSKSVLKEGIQPMKKYISLLPLLITLCVGTFGQQAPQTAIAQDGRKVLLLSDGTWKYEQVEVASSIHSVSATENGERIVYQAPGSPFYHKYSSCRLSTSLVRPVSLEDAIKDHAQYCSLCFPAAPTIEAVATGEAVDTAPAINAGLTLPPLSSPSSPSPKHTPGTAVNVRGYTRKDGTYVAPHTRSAPGRKH